VTGVYASVGQLHLTIAWNKHDKKHMYILCFFATLMRVLVIPGKEQPGDWSYYFEGDIANYYVKPYSSLARGITDR